MGWFEEATRRRTAEIRDQGRWRTIRTLRAGGTTTTMTATGEPVVQFASNDYLGLSMHPDVAEAAARAAKETGFGSGASRLVVGSRREHDQLEDALARWKRPDLEDSAALLFPTGYAANLGTLGAVGAAAAATAGGPGKAVVFSDELNHASIIDGTRLSRLPVEVYPHLDLAELESRLAARSGAPSVVVSDVVFSMDGDVLDVAAMSSICARHGALLVLDVAHDVFDAASEVVDGADVLVVGTLSKSLGSLGGYVVGSRAAIEMVLNTARPFIFSTATPPPVAAAAAAALAIETSAEGARRRARLRDNIDRLRPGHPSPIIPVVIGDDDEAMEVSAALLEQGLLVPAIRPPTVPAGTSRLRVALCALHTRGQLDMLSEALAELGHPVGSVGGGGAVSGSPASGGPA